jgi:hypothetical protein
MALALNVFKTKVYELTLTDDIIYTAPAGKSAIILMAQIANVTANPITCTVAHYFDSVTTELIKDFVVPGADSVSAVQGKLVLEEGHSIRAIASDDHSLKITLSILESVNG